MRKEPEMMTVKIRMEGQGSGGISLEKILDKNMSLITHHTKMIRLLSIEVKCAHF